MKLSNSEKLILTMLAEIHEKLGIENGTDTKFLTSGDLQQQHLGPVVQNA